MTDCQRQLHNANSSTPIEPYNPKIYIPPEPIVRTHLLPRLGFRKNIGVLWTGSDDQMETYIIGICIGSIFIVGVLALCLLVMSFLKCAGYDRVGFWAGHFEYEEDVEDVEEDGIVKTERDVGIMENESAGAGIMAVTTIGSGEFNDRGNHISIAVEEAIVGNELLRESASPVSSDVLKMDDGMDDSEDESTIVKSKQPTLNRFLLKVEWIGPDGKVIALQPKPVPKNLYLKVNAVRYMFIFSGIGAIISAGLFYGLGVKKFQQSLVDTRSGINQFNSIASKSIDVTDNLLDVQQQLESSLNNTDEALDIIASSCNLESFANAANFSYHYETVKSHFISFGDATAHLLNGFSDDMTNIIEATTLVHDGTYKANIAFAIMVLIMCIMIILIFIMIIGVAFAAYEIDNCFTCFMRRVILLPIFVVQVVLATLFAAIFFIGALAGSDFCIMPDQHAHKMFADVAAGADSSLSPLFTLALFYLSGCEQVNDLEVARTVQDVVEGADSLLLLTHDLFDTANQLTPQDILTYCNVSKEFIGQFDDLGVTLHNITHQLHDSLDATLDIISCKSVHPVYSNLVHDAVCVGAVGGVEAIFSTMLGIAVLSMTMMALRAALYPIQQSHSAVAADDRELTLTEQ